MCDESIAAFHTVQRLRFVPKKERAPNKYDTPSCPFSDPSRQASRKKSVRQSSNVNRMRRACRHREKLDSEDSSTDEFEERPYRTSATEYRMRDNFSRSPTQADQNASVVTTTTTTSVITTTSVQQESCRPQPRCVCDTPEALSSPYHPDNFIDGWRAGLFVVPHPRSYRFPGCTCTR